MADRLIGATFAGRYRIDAELGAGGFGVVYRAWDVELSRYVALKLLHPVFASHPGTVQLFRREASLLAGLDHPNIVPIYDIGTSRDSYFIVMKLVPGRSLEQILETEDPYKGF